MSESSKTVRGHTDVASALVGFSLLCLASVSFAQTTSSAFSGRWEGWREIDHRHNVAESSDGEEPNARRRPDFRMEISEDGEVELLFRRERGGWRPSSVPFVLTEHGNGAFITGQHRTIEWVESQTFNVTKVDEDTLQFFWWRVVNNIFNEPGDDYFKWAIGGHGEIRRRGRR